MAKPCKIVVSNFSFPGHPSNNDHFAEVLLLFREFVIEFRTTTCRQVGILYYLPPTIKTITAKEEKEKTLPEAFKKHIDQAKEKGVA